MQQAFPFLAVETIFAVSKRHGNLIYVHTAYTKYLLSILHGIINVKLKLYFLYYQIPFITTTHLSFT